MIHFKLLRNDNPLVHNFKLVQGASIERDEVERDIYKACKKFQKDLKLLPGEIYGVAWIERVNSISMLMGIRIFQVDPKNPEGVIDMKVETPVNLDG
jgi:hypothetical protein